ncbi:hypothetical protein [Alkalihalobacillus trypoxylicola]|uniref:hypothetical protein n=1 Tax=Alkalihalobacillus trypoxylicola TaxID=519424 RepID=UPI000A504DEC|nr:hypothetical protein [Alkalihalobacillus trypoxylicola]
MLRIDNGKIMKNDIEIVANMYPHFSGEGFYVKMLSHGKDFTVANREEALSRVEEVLK